MILFLVKDNLLTFHQEVIRNIPEFATILRKRMPSKGDSEGRLKEMNLKVFMFIFFVSEFRKINPLCGEPDEVRIRKAKTYAGLPDFWEPDSDVQAGVDKYLEILLTIAPSIKLLKAARLGISQAAEQITMAVEQNQKILEAVSKATTATFGLDPTAPEYGKNLELLARLNDVFNGNVSSLRATVKDMKNMHKTVEEFEVLVGEEVEVNEPIYGGGVLNPRELPPAQRIGKGRPSPAGE